MSLFIALRGNLNLVVRIIDLLNKYYIDFSTCNCNKSYLIKYRI